MQQRAEIIREKGTNRAAFLRNETRGYEWLDVGSSYLPGECQAAALSVQLSAAKQVTEQRRYLWYRYQQLISYSCEPNSSLLFSVPEYCYHNGHLFGLKMPDIRSRKSLQASLARQGVFAQTHYVPLHSSPAGRHYGRVSGCMQETDFLADCFLRLPLYYALTDEEQDFVIDKVMEGLARL